MKQEMNGNIFDQMVFQHSTTSPIPMKPQSPQHTRTRWKPDGNYVKKPFDPDYFATLYQLVGGLERCFYFSIYWE